MLKRTKNIFLVFVILSLVSLVVYGFLLWNLNERQSDLLELREMVESKKVEHQEVKEAFDFWQEQESEIKGVQEHFLAHREDPEMALIEKLEHITAESGVTLLEGGETYYTTRNDLEVLKTDNMKFIGSWNEVLSTIALLEAMPYQSELELVNMSVPRGRQNSWEAKVSFIVTYNMAEQE